MGFYGKISNSNKTAFSFDRTYSTRVSMDAAAATDGVFIGRYVLVEYDEPPITGYYNAQTGQFYSSISQGSQSQITPRTGVVYQDLVHVGSVHSFYEWNPQSQLYQPLGTTTGYASNFQVDVTQYGRGYDSTAWMKTYDVAKNVYRYVLVAELNTVVPVFHLITDAPSANPTAPYFDQDTTTVDYYLHAQASYGARIRPYNVSKLGDNIHDARNVIDQSDEDVLTNYTSINVDPNGVQTYVWNNDSTIQGDIYYNKEGFKKVKHTMSPRTLNQNQEEIALIEDTINYDFNFSGRKYGGGLTDRGVWNEGILEHDMLDWYIHLPVLGDTICEVWDVLYGYNNNPNNQNYLDRYIKLTDHRSDEDEHVSYSHNTVYGSLNMVRDVLGYPIAHMSNLIALDEQTKEIAEQQSEAATHLIHTGDRGIANKLYYTSHYIESKEEEVRDDYYYYTYDPNHIRVYKKDGTESTYYYTGADDPSVTAEFDVSELYFRDTNGHYRKPNLLDWPSQLTDGTWVGTEYNELYARVDAWTLCKLSTPIEDSLYGLVIQLHRLMGDHSPEVRDENSIIGCINLTKDMIARIDKDLAPCKLLATTVTGQIHTTNTEFPYYATRKIVTDKYNVEHSVQKGHECLTSDGLWRLIVDYNLYTYTEMNATNGLAYFDAGYYGNSNNHIVEQTDSLGTAIRKISNELADLNYQQQTAKLFAHVNTEGEANTEYLFVENGRDITDVTLDYELNKGPRYNIQLKRLGDPNVVIYETTVSDTLAHLANGYAATASGTKHDTEIITGLGHIDTDITYQISVIDERSYTATADAVIKYMNKCYWGVGTAHDAAAFTTLGDLNSMLVGGSKLTREKFSPPTMHAGVNEYVYWLQPASFTDPTFRISCVEGGMDYLGTVTFRNGYNYSTNYKVWRSTQTNLGIVDLVVL